jgi:O-antigen ligase
LLSFFITLALACINIWSQFGEKVIRKAYIFFISLLPISLGFWYYKTIFEFKHKQVYFTYDHALFFLSDGLALLAIILWLTLQTQKSSLPKLSPTLKLLFTLCLWMSLSSPWSANWQTSLYISIHFWLIFLLILAMRDLPQETWSGALLGFCIGLITQAGIGLVEFSTQSTRFLEPLNLHWPGLIDASSKSAGILKFANGENFLRVYGTFPHPNILAGFTLLCIAAATALLLNKNKKYWLAGIVLAIASSLLAVTFSRSAWLGYLIFFLVVFIKSKSFNSKRIWLAFSISIIAFGLTLFPLQELFLSRTAIPTSTVEKFSLSGRVWLSQKALEYIKEKPLNGIGSGSFVIQLAERAGEFNYVEPVHNIPLLIFSELGLVGFILFMAIAALITKDLFVTKDPSVIIIGALLVALGTIFLFDHYFWSLAPGRLMLGMALGLWEGQTARDL